MSANPFEGSVNQIWHTHTDPSIGFDESAEPSTAGNFLWLLLSHGLRPRLEESPPHYSPKPNRRQIWSEEEESRGEPWDSLFKSFLPARSD